MKNALAIHTQVFYIVTDSTPDFTVIFLVCSCLKIWWGLHNATNFSKIKAFIS